jgi:hypothetical protein
MKKHLTSLFAFLVLTTILNAQTGFDTQFAGIKSELQKWDQVRGEWLANSLVALSNRTAVPDRTFPEEFTPYEMLTLVPMDKRRDILTAVQQGRKASTTEFNQNWQRVEYVVNHSFCDQLMGRSYGDPHLNSFDNASYSFQTVGEFVLSKSNQGHFEVQSRQRPQSDNFSLNTAIAMNVGGDRLCFYSDEKPDGNQSALRLDGDPIQMQGRTYFLPHGGTIRLEGRNYIVSWPTGESVILDKRASGTMNFANVTVKIFGCDQGDFQGLLGNANGMMDDDFNSNNNNTRPVYASFSTFGNPAMQQVSQNAEKEYLSFLAKDFADEWRVTDLNTLFDYGMGRSTVSYTDRTFPRVHYTLNDMNSDQQSIARRRCEQMGISQSEMRGCIFDNGFLNINPNPIPTPTNPTQGATLPIVIKPHFNNNHSVFADGGALGSGGGAHPITPNGDKGDVNAGELNPTPNNEPLNKGTDIDAPKIRPHVNPVPTEKPETSSPVNTERPNHNINININPRPNPTPATTPAGPTHQATPNFKGVKIGKG